MQSIKFSESNDGSIQPTPFATKSKQFTIVDNDNVQSPIPASGGNTFILPKVDADTAETSKAKAVTFLIPPAI